MDPDSETDWYQKLTDSHFVEVGRAVTEWGELEAQIYRYLEENLRPEKLYKYLSKKLLSFHSRCDLLVAAVGHKFDDPADLEGLEQALQTAKDLTGDRNLLAHNPMQFWVDDTRTRITGGIVQGRTGRPTDFDIEAVKEFGAKAKEARFAIMRAMLGANDQSA